MVVTMATAELAIVANSRCAITRLSMVFSVKVAMANMLLFGRKLLSEFLRIWILLRLRLCCVLVGCSKIRSSTSDQDANRYKGVTVFNGMRQCDVLAGGTVAIQGLGGLGKETRSASKCIHRDANLCD